VLPQYVKRLPVRSGAATDSADHRLAFSMRLESEFLHNIKGYDVPVSS
jgi:hypothetical protein